MSGPAGQLGEPQPWNRLASWAVGARRALDDIDQRHFCGESTAWIWSADSHELIEMHEEGMNLPDEIWRAVVRSERRSS